MILNKKKSESSTLKPELPSLYLFTFLKHGIRMYLVEWNQKQNNSELKIL